MEFEFPIAPPGHKFVPEEELVRRSSPVDVMTREASLERKSGEPSLLADQTTVCKLLYQTEKVKPFFRARKPAAKVELGESRILPWVGSHGDFKEEKEVRFSCDDGEGLKKRIREKRR